MGEGGIVAKEQEGGRGGANLGAVVDFELARAFGRGLVAVLGGAQDLVDGGGRDVAHALFVHFQRGGEHLRGALTGQGGDVEHGDEIEEVQLMAHMLGEGVHRVCVFFEGVPFVDYDHDTFPGFLNEPGNVRILGGDASFGIHDQESDIRALDGTVGAEDAVFFDARFDTAALANAGGINKGDRDIVEGHPGVNRVAGGPRDGADNGALFAH